MLVVAVATVLIIRIILEASGYPKLAGGGLHIAHVLYGGLMMFGALILVFAFLNMSVRWLAAFVGGVGFGFFIDEVGKFISNDVNYFFEPAVAVMYVVFMVLFLLAYAIRRARMRPHDSLANALSLLREERDGTSTPRRRPRSSCSWTTPTRATRSCPSCATGSPSRRPACAATSPPTGRCGPAWPRGTRASPSTIGLDAGARDHDPLRAASAPWVPAHPLHRRAGRGR